MLVFRTGEQTLNKQACFAGIVVRVGVAHRYLANQPPPLDSTGTPPPELEADLGKVSALTGKVGPCSGGGTIITWIGWASATGLWVCPSTVRMGHIRASTHTRAGQGLRRSPR